MKAEETQNGWMDHSSHYYYDHPRSHFVQSHSLVPIVCVRRYHMPRLIKVGLIKYKQLFTLDAPWHTFAHRDTLINIIIININFMADGATPTTPLNVLCSSVDVKYKRINWRMAWQT